jgi:hypothetical protein
MLERGDSIAQGAQRYNAKLCNLDRNAIVVGRRRLLDCRIELRQGRGA